MVDCFDQTGRELLDQFSSKCYVENFSRKQLGEEYFSA